MKGKSMSNLVPFGGYGSPGSSLSPRVAKALGRQLGSIEAGGAVALAQIDVAVQRREAVTDGVTSIAARAMQHVAAVSQTEVQMALTVPNASGRLAAVADAHALAMTGIVIDTARALGRLA